MPNPNSSAEPRLAVIIDADNVSAAPIRELMAEIARHGTPTVRRIYGDWTQPSMNPWKHVLHEHAITPVQQYRNTVGKNATDSAMIIDAMDILYSGNVEGFCIVSSDADFTRLATRLREAGMRVLGFGAKQTPRPFVAACEQFVYLEVLREKPAAKVKPAPVEVITEAAEREDMAGPADLDAITRLLHEIVDDLADDDGWASLGAVGNQILRQHPDFDTRLYGYAKLSRLVAALTDFELEKRPNSAGSGYTYCVRERD